MSDGPRGMVFRDGAAAVAGATLRDALIGATTGAQQTAAREAARLEALLRAGAWECALADGGVPDEERAMDVTDAIAGAYLTGQGARLAGLAARIAAIETPAEARVSVPEGFAYYALHPRDFAEAARAAALRGPFLVVGVRTIGATLSAIVRAALATGETPATRFTVRPSGHPYDRVTALTPQQVASVRATASAGGTCVIVDEGPGISGSSFLSVADALAAAGAPAQRIVLLGSRAVDPATLVARDAAARWARYHTVAATTGGRCPPDAALGLSGGVWRFLFFGDPERWPAAWPAMERLKYQSSDGRSLLKFEGLGPYGAAVHARAAILADAGIAPLPEGPPDENGFVRYAMLDGRPLAPQDLDDELIAALAGYCARRAALFPAPATGAEETTLASITRENVHVALERPLPDAFQIRCERVTLCDGRMMPCEWVRTSGALYKTDGVTHGDDHFNPGPTDIAWDLAGAGVEWGIPCARLAELYTRASGDDVGARLPSFVVAYAAFRAALCGMAAHGSAHDERDRLLGARARYVRALEGALADLR